MLTHFPIRKGGKRTEIAEDICDKDKKSLTVIKIPITVSLVKKLMKKVKRTSAVTTAIAGFTSVVQNFAKGQ